MKRSGTKMRIALKTLIDFKSKNTKDSIDFSRQKYNYFD